MNHGRQWLKAAILWMGLLVNSCTDHDENIPQAPNATKQTASHHQEPKKPSSKTIAIQDSVYNVLSTDSVITIDITACKTSENREDQVLLTNFKSKSLEAMLGEHDAASILKNYNPHLAGKGLGTDIRSIDSIIIPRYSNKQIEAFFDKSLGVFLAKHDSIAQLTGANKNAIITTQNEQWLFYTGVYVDGILRLAFPASPGVWGKDRDIQWNPFRRFTPLGSYVVQAMDVDYKSKANDFMTFLMLYYPPRGLGAHGWQKVNAKRRSHWCERLVHIYAYLTRKEVYEKYSAGELVTFVNFRSPTAGEIEDAKNYLQHKIPLDNSWKDTTSNNKPVLTSKNIDENGEPKIDTVDFRVFAYLYHLDETGKSLIDTLNIGEKISVESGPGNTTNNYYNKK